MRLHRIMNCLLVCLCLSCSNQQQTAPQGKNMSYSLQELAAATAGNPTSAARENMLDRNYHFLAIIDDQGIAVIPGVDENINKLVVRQYGYPYKYKTLPAMSKDINDPQQQDISHKAYKYAATYNDTLMSLMRQQPLSSGGRSSIDLPVH